MICRNLSLSIAMFGLTVGTQTPTTTSGLPPGVKSLRVNGYEMAYVERGTGEPVLLVHGTLTDFRYFAGVMEPLSAKYRVIAVSLRHYYPERWDGNGGHFSLRQHVADVVAFIQTLNSGPVHLVGHSRGGHVALYVAREYGELVRTLTLAEPAPGMPAFDDDPQLARQFRQKTVAMFEQGGIDAGLEHFVDGVGGPASWKAVPEPIRQVFRSNAWTLKGEVSDTYDPYTCADAGRIAVPVLLIAGKKSPPFFGKILDAVQRCLKRSERVVIPNASHGMPRQNAAGFSEAVLNFISKPAASPSTHSSGSQDEDTRVPGRELAAAVNLHRKDMKAEGTLFLAHGVRQIRAVIVVINWGPLSQHLFEDPQWRKLSETLASGLLHVRISQIGSSVRTRVTPSGRIVPDLAPVSRPERNAALDGVADAFQILLERFAEESGRQELRRAPLLLWGHSAAGSLAATYAALHPGRTIAFVRYHSHQRGLPLDMKVVTEIPALLFAGQNDETAGVEDIQELWKRGRSISAPWTFVLRSDAPHSSIEAVEKANEVAIPWITAVFRQRLVTGSAGLRTVSDSSAWMGDHQTLEIALHASFSGSKTDASWLPDETTARAWRVASDVVRNESRAQVGPNGEIDGLTAKFVDVNGVRTRYYDYGQGETIVLLHGGQALRDMQGSANTWSRNILGLARKFRVLALDRIGSGMTGHPKDDRKFGVEGDVEHVYQFIRAMNVDKVHVVGHSSGTPPEVDLALKHPDIVKSVILVSAGAGRHFRAGPTKRSVILAKCPADTASDEYRKCFRASLLPPQAFQPYNEQAEVWMAKLPKALEGRQRVAALRSEQPQLFDEERAHEDRMWDKVREGALQVPVLVYGGNQDLWDWDADAPQATMQGAMNLVHTLGAKNPRVKIVIINGAGHFVYREQPEQFNADLIQFIEFWNNHTSSRARADFGASR